MKMLLDLLLMSTCISFELIFRIFPSNFILQCNNVQWKCTMKVSLHEFAVDFVHNLHFQVKLEKCECHADAHNSIEIKASGKNNTKSTTELSPVLILDSSQIPAPRLHIKLLVGLSWDCSRSALHQKEREWEGLKASLIIEVIEDCFQIIFMGTLGAPAPSHLIKVAVASHALPNFPWIALRSQN